MSNKVVKGFLGTVILLSGLLSFTQIAKAQVIGTTTDPVNSPWTNGSIDVVPSSLQSFSNGARAVFTVKVSPPINDANNNQTIEDSELNAWMYIDGKGGSLGATGTNRTNTQGFVVEVSTDATFSTTSTVVRHPIDVTTNVVSTVVDIRIGPPADTALLPSTTYNFRVIGLSPGGTDTHVLYGQTFTTQAPGADIQPLAPGANTSGNTIVGNGANLTANEIDPTTGLPECGILSSSKVFGCIGQIMYYILFVPTSWVMVLAGEIMDFGIGYSISSTSYPVSGHSFVTDGWRIMRDIANIFFIFILIYVAISTILGQDKKKLIGWVILVALVINFSLFLTKVVVDFGNITSRFFYNNISITNPQTATTIVGASGHKSISYGFASTFNPIKLFANVNRQSTTINSAGGVIATGMSDEQFAGFFTVFALVGAVVNLVAAFVFFSMAWLFIARTIGIWLSMIFAPLAFLSLTLPDKWDLGGAAGGGAGKYMKFGSWWSNLTKLAVMPAIAMLMIFLILTFLKSNFLGNIPNETTTGQFIGVLLPLIMVSYLLLQTKKTAESMAGDFGGMMSKAGNFVGGAALGLATGGTALLARKTIGAGAMKLAESEKFKNYASKSRIGQKLWQGTKSISNSSFDARNVKIMGKDLASTGLGVGKVKSEGYIKDAQNKAKKQKKTADSFDASEKERENQKHLENEHLRKEFLMKRGEKDPYTGEVPTQTEVDEAKNIATAEKSRIESVYLKRRENYAQRVEQGDGLGYLVNKVTRKKPTDEMRQSLTDAQNDLNTLTTAGIGGLDANGKTITKQTLDDAQKKVTGAKQKMTQAETGWVGAHDNSTAQAIRSSKKMKKTYDPNDPQSAIDVQEERTQAMLDKLKEELGGKKKDSPEEIKKKEGSPEGTKQTQSQPAEEVPVAPGNYTGTNVGFKPQPKAQNQQSNQPTVNAPIGFRPQANANFTGGNYGRNNVKQPANQYGNLGGVDDNRKQNTGPQINSTAPINISNSKININTTGGLAANGNNSQGSYSRSEVGFNRENNQSENRRIGFQFGGNTANEKAEVASKIGKEAPITNTTTSAQTPTERKPIEGLFGNREAAQSKTPEERANRFEQKTFERRPLQRARPAPKPAPAAITTETSTEPEPKRNVVKGFFGGKDE